MADLSAHPIINRLFTRLANVTGSIHQAGDTLPSPLPAGFIVLQALGGPVSNDWDVQKDATQLVQILCCNTSREAARNMSQAVNAALQATEFTVLRATGETKFNAHFEVPLTVQVTT